MVLRNAAIQTRHVEESKWYTWPLNYKGFFYDSSYNNEDTGSGTHRTHSTHERVGSHRMPTRHLWTPTNTSHAHTPDKVLTSGWVCQHCQPRTVVVIGHLLPPPTP